MGLLRQVRRLWRGLWRRPPPPAPDSTLVLRRPGRGLLARAWAVEIDGSPVAKLRPGAERRLRVHSGRHVLNLWAGDEGSLPLVVILTPGETVTVEAMTMARAVHLGLVEAGFAPDPLLLRRIG
ncbi:hypothetical protein [Jannaschia formosa]|uniref:hypothetical protein n=1 Tax=Jannaschia formosa TaxID=2259592 RepID=UPI000E1C2761|nr:hypothetical protein [Jannaschia formosa]TFL18728.1 hypothetical protein DR046_07310 [Jannaschia formosa]